ncbi:MAG: hypothetical protein HYV93_17710 [Candidatus Rokubacteria bacterium]|nr:hypothetical protein [Candidatus Rokubacteria bacterium]
MRWPGTLARARAVVLSALLLGIWAGVGVAATITPESGTMEASIISPISIPAVAAFDVRGTMSFMVSAPGSVGFALLTDMFDLATPAPFPNSALLGLNLGFGEHAVVVFDASELEVTDGFMTVPATGIPVGPVSDPALSAFLGPLVFGFRFDGAGSAFDFEHDTAFLNFDLVSVGQVPAPGSLVLLVLGAMATARAAARGRRR